MDPFPYSQIPAKFQPFLLELGEELKGFYRQKQGHQPKEIAVEADLLSSKRIMEELASSYPDHNRLGEESGLNWQDSPHTWVVDPIDGSSNYGASFPLWAVSIALCVDGKAKVGMVYLPEFKSFYWAVEGEGAFLNGDPISTLKDDDYKNYYLIGSSGTNGEKSFQPGKIRRVGAVAVDLVYLAEGKFSTIYEPEPHIWDMIGGYVIAIEAGAIIYRGDGEPMEPFNFEDTSPFEILGKANSELANPDWK